MFITLEGIEGSGKTTQIEGLRNYFEDLGHRCVVTREPGGTAIGRKIREILLNPANDELLPMAELLLYMADRAQHLDAVVRPALAEGKVVLSDRYFDATVVYQGDARGLDVNLIYRLHALLFDDLKPDLTLLLDLPPQMGLGRVWLQLNKGSRSGRESRFEEETLGFHEKIRTGYLALARRNPDRFAVIDASQAENQVQYDLRNAVSAYLTLRQ
jgi:dTMP kinase